MPKFAFASQELLNSFLSQPGYSQETIRSYRRIITKFFDYLEGRSVQGFSSYHRIQNAVSNFLTNEDIKSSASFLTFKRIIGIYLNWCWKNELGGIERPISISARWSPTKDTMYGNDMRKYSNIKSIITKEEIKKLLTILKQASPKDYIAYVLMYNYGLRVGEICNLQFKHVCMLEDGKYHIWINGKTSRKTKYGRLVEIPYILYQDIIALNPIAHTEKTDAYVYTGNRNFLTENKETKYRPMSTSWFNINFKKICKEILGQERTTHFMRKSRITHMLQDGVSVYDIASVVGIASVSTLKQHYDHSVVNERLQNIQL